MMYERITEKAVKAAIMAQAESRRSGLDNADTTMLALGVIAEGSDTGCKALALRDFAR